MDWMINAILLLGTLLGVGFYAGGTGRSHRDRGRNKGPQGKRR